MSLSDIDITGYKTLLLDRDGTINRLIVGDYVRRWEDFAFLPGVLDAIRRFSTLVDHIIIVTNQRGVGKGLLTVADLEYIHRKMCDVIRNHGGRIDGIYFCCATSDSDHDRKPNVGMFERICKDFPDVKKETTLMVGDSITDQTFAENCGIMFQMVNN